MDSGRGSTSGVETPIRVRGGTGGVLRLVDGTYDAILDHALEAAPQEACGVLGGEYGESRSRVVTIEPAENVAADPRSAYAIDPERLFAAMEALRGDGHDVVGFYHSHPAGPPGPSGTDADLASWPRRSYVIASLAGAHPFVGSWRWDDEGTRFVREVLRPA